MTCQLTWLHLIKIGLNFKNSGSGIRIFKFPEIRNYLNFVWKRFIRGQILSWMIHFFFSVFTNFTWKIGITNATYPQTILSHFLLLSLYYMCFVFDGFITALWYKARWNRSSRGHCTPEWNSTMRNHDQDDK